MQDETVPHRRQDVIIRETPDASIPEADDSESYSQMKQRLVDWWDDVLEAHSTQKTIAAVIHSGGLNALLDHIFNAGDSRMCDVIPPPASLSHFNNQPDTPYEPWRIYTIGSTNHLVNLD